MEFVDALIEDRAILMDQDSAALDSQSVSGHDATMEEVKNYIHNLTVSMQTQFKGIQLQLEVQETRNALSEVSSR